MSGNPLVAGPVTTTTALSGTGLIEDISATAQAIHNKDWVGAALSGFASTMDTVAAAIDPIGTLIAWGAGWLLDHLEPLKGWLNDLTGDAGAVAGFAQTWVNVGTRMSQEAALLTNRVDADLSEITGEAIEAYRAYAADLAKHIGAMQEASNAVAGGLQTASTIVQVVHELVRDTLAQIIGSLSSAILQAVCSVGVLIPKVIADVSARVAALAGRIGTTVKAVLEAMGKLRNLVTKLGETMSKIRALLRHGDDVPAGGGGARTARSTTRPGSEPPSTRANAEEPGSARSGSEVPDCGDPVDVATGRVVMDQTDLELAGALPLVLGRRFVSGYRYPAAHGPRAGWFGDGWFSLFDERLVVDREGVILVRADGAHLAYPAPEFGGPPVLPERGTSRWPLSWGAQGYQVVDPLTGQTRWFDEPPVEPEQPEVGETPALLTRIQDRAGRWTTIVRDAVGAPTRVRTSGGYEVLVGTLDARVTGLSVADRDEVVDVVAFGYADGMLAEVRRGGHTEATRFTYDDEARLLSWVDANAVRYDYAYDEAGRCTWQSAVDGAMGYTYDWSGHTRPDRRDGETGLRQTLVTDSLGHRQRFVVDDDGRLAATVDPIGARSSNGYDDVGRLAATVDALGNTTRYHYDADGRTTGVTYPDATRVSVAFDSDGAPEEVTQRDGAVWRYAFDDRGLPLTETDPSGATTTYAYDPLGGLAAVTSADGHTTVVTCDAAGLPVRTVDAAGGETRYERDGFGRIVLTTDALGHESRFAWDTAGRPVHRIAADRGETRWEYDAEGNLIRHVDAAGRSTTMTYAGFDRLRTIESADGSRTAYDWDTELRLTAVTNPQGLRWTLERDPAGRVVAETDYSGRTTRFEHDLAGRILLRRNGADQTVSFDYDQVGQLVHKRADDGTEAAYGYDRAGRLVRAVQAGVLLERRYDAAGRLTTESVDGRITRFEHDAVGRLTTRVTPSGETVRWEHDPAGAVVALATGTHRLALARDALGRETTRSLDTGLVLTSTWDPMDRLLERTTTGSAADRSVDYAWSPTSELIAEVDSRRGTTQYELDRAGRVTSVRNSEDPSESYSYNDFGDVTAAAWGSNTSSSVTSTEGERTYRGTLLVAAGRDRFHYDGEGRRVRRRRALPSGGTQEWQYEWDVDDRLTSVTTPDGTVWRYRYDALGRRVAKDRLDSAGSVVEVTHFTWHDFTLVEQTHDTRSGRPVSTTWAHVGNAPVAQTRSTGSQADVDAEFYAIVTDMVGTPTELISASGDSAWRSSATLWGLQRGGGDRGDDLMPLRFPGQYADDETGLYYNVFRYYDPATGRFVSADPLGLSPQPNPYAYPRNPHTLVDPLGLTPCTPDPGRNGALNQAKRDLGIPRSQQPDSVDRVPLTDRNGRAILGPDHQPIVTREYHYTAPNGEHIVIQDHGAGHQFGEGGVGDQGPHLNVRPGDDTRGGAVPGTKPHYPFTR